MCPAGEPSPSQHSRNPEWPPPPYTRQNLTDCATAGRTLFLRLTIRCGTIRTIRIMPRGSDGLAAAELILSGRQFDAKEALDLGLVNRIVAGNELLKEAIALRRSSPKSHRSRSP